MSPDNSDSPEITIPEHLPILPLNEGIVYPHMIAPLAVQARDVPLVDAVVSGNRLLGVVARRPQPEGESPSEPESLYDVGSATVVQKMLQLPDESRRLLIRGTARIRLEEYVQTEPFRIARISVIQEADEDSEEIQARTQSLLNTFQQIVQLSVILPEEAYLQALNVPTRSALCDLVVGFNRGMQVFRRDTTSRRQLVY